MPAHEIQSHLFVSEALAPETTHHLYEYTADVKANRGDEVCAVSAPSLRLPAISTAPSELYPFVFFLLRAHANGCALLLNTSTIYGIDSLNNLL